VSILEQNYEYDLVSAEKILQKYLDQVVQLYTKEGKIFEGKLSCGITKKKMLKLSTESTSGVIMKAGNLPIHTIRKMQIPWNLSYP